MNIKEKLKEATQGILTESTLNEIQNAFDVSVNEKVSLQIEQALVMQDAEYTSKLKDLLIAIDNDHGKKLQSVVESIDLNNARKLKTVVKKYNKIVTEQASKFKHNIVNKISDYIELYIEEKIPQKAVLEAVRNRNAALVLSNLREHLAIDSSLMKKSVRTAVLDGSRQINEARRELETTRRQNSALRESLATVQANLIVEQRTSNLPGKKKEYAKRVLEGKTPKFISENIDYTLSLFDKSHEDRLEMLKFEASKNLSKADVIIEEEVDYTRSNNRTKRSNNNSNNTTARYMSELGKF